VRVLVVGSGGREHALTWAICKSPLLEKVFIAPGNGGTESMGQNVAIDPLDVGALAGFARQERIDLTVVGPEAPLTAGIVDTFREHGLLCFGPTSAGAQLEGSKVFAKQFMERHGIPTAPYEIFHDPVDAKAYLRERGAPVVVKADGLAQGKGVYVADTLQDAIAAVDEIMVERRFGESGRRIVIESLLKGEELSVHAICCGNGAFVLPSSQDHKRIFDGDEGPNTGGMGAYAPVPFVDAGLKNRIMTEILMPVVEGMHKDGTPYAGVLYAGLMISEKGPQVLEFNVRFGDPETQVLVPLIRSDFLELLFTAAQGTLPDSVELFESMSAATVVMASKGYPGTYAKGFAVTGIESVTDERRFVFHAGTSRSGGAILTSGGRVLAVTSLGENLAGALEHAYEGVRRIRFQDAYWRHDIGKRAL
jgi:phosphoribosylamine--glycine ligase